MIKNIVIIGLFFMLSCESSENCCTNIEADTLIKVTDNEGNDLLNPENGTIDQSQIKVFYDNEQGTILEVHQPNLDSPKGFKIISPSADNSSFYKIQIFLNTKYINSDNISHTTIKWTEDDIDEIQAQFDRRGNNLTVRKIWINNQLIWELNNEKLITLIKQL